MPLAANETKGKPRLIAARPNHTKRSQSIYIFVGIAAVASCRLKKQVCDSCPACRTSVVSHIMEGPETRASAGLSRGGDGAKPSKDETSPRSAKNRFHSFRLQMAGSHAFANIPRQSNTSGAGGKRRDPFSQNRGSVNRKKKQSLIDTTKDVPQASSMAERRPVFGDMARSIQKQVAGVRAFANKHRVDERERPKQSETISQRSAKDRFHSVQLQVAGTHAFANIPRHGDGKKKLAEDQGDVDHGVGRQTTALERSPWDGIGSVAREESDQVQDIEFTRRQQRTADDRLRSAKQKLAAVTAFSRKSNDKDADLEDQTSSEFSSRQQRTVGDRLRSAKQKLAAVTAFSRKSNDEDAESDRTPLNNSTFSFATQMEMISGKIALRTALEKCSLFCCKEVFFILPLSVFGCITHAFFFRKYFLFGPGFFVASPFLFLSIVCIALPMSMFIRIAMIACPARQQIGDSTYSREHPFAETRASADGKKKLAEDQGDVDHGVGRQTTAPERSPGDEIGSVAREESDQVQDIEFTRRQQRTADDRLRSAKQKLAAVTAFSRKSNDKDADLEDQTSSEFSSRQQRTVGDRLRSAKQKLAAVTAFSRKSNDKEADLEDQASSEFSSRQQRTVGDRLRSADTELDRTSPQFTRRQQCARRAYSSMFSCISSCCTCARRVYSSMFDLNGRFFIFKMYFMEMLATMLQLYNMKHIYLCTMGLGDVYIALSILVFELVSIVHTTFHLTPETRDRQLVIDVFTDVFFLGYPVFMIGEVYTIPIDAQQTMLLTIFPTFSILSKMNDVWEALYVVTAEAAIAGKHTIPAENRRIVSQSVTKVPQISKKSIFKEIMIGSGKLPAVCKPPPPPPRRSIMSFQISNETFDEQLRCFPRCARCMCIFVNGLFCVFFLVIAGLQLSALNVAENGLHMSQIECIEQHTGEIWYSCKLQVPFCVETIYPRCDCAIVRMLNYSRTVLPPNFTQMRSVLKLQIYKGELEAIASLKGLSSLLTLEVIGTKLKSLHAETATHIPNLLQLVLIENRLTALPDLSNMTQLTRLHVYSNELTLLPPLPKNIVILFAYNNKLTSLPVTFSGLRQLRQCRLFNNRLAAFPEGIGGLENLEELLAWNNTIEKLPESISHLKKLKAADVRNNKLSVLPEKINEIRLMYFSLNGNPICSLGILSGEKCKKPCSPDCSPSLLHNEKCDDLIRVYKTTTLFDPQDEGARLVKRARSGSGCFTEACKKDDGACSIERGDPLPFRSD